MLSKTTIIFFAFIATTSSAEYAIRAPKPDNSTKLIVEAMIGVITSCYENERLPIGLYGNMPKNFLETLWSQKFIPILLLDEIRCLWRGNLLYQQKLNIFVIIATDAREFIHVFKGIGCKGRFSNRRASFLIVEWSPTREYGCHYNRTGEMIRAAWDNKVINVNVLCLHSTKGRIIYSYNPFMNRAPAPWELIESLDKSRKYSYVSFFEQQYQKNGSCKNLFFDKLKDMGGAPIPYVKLSTSWGSPKPGSQFRRMLVLEEEFLNVVNTFARQINGILTRTSPRGREGLALIFTNMHQNLDSVRTAVENTYPYKQMDLLIVTHFRGYKSQLSKILNVVDIYSQLGVCIVLLLTLIFLKFVTHQAVIPASLNVFRVICNTGLLNLSEATASRLYRVGLYFFMITIHGIFAGNLASLLTRDIPIEHPKSIIELVDDNYTIYHASLYDDLFDDVQDRVHEVSLEYYGDICLEQIVDQGPLTACVAPAHEVLDVVTDNNFYVSETPISRMYRTIRTGPHWMFADKFNKVHSRMVAADIVETLDMRVAKQVISRVHFFEGPRNMNLNDLFFAFIILGIGLLCAFSCFIAEISILIGRKCFVIGQNRRNLLNYFRRTEASNLKMLKIQKVKVKEIKN